MHNNYMNIQHITSQVPGKKIQYDPGCGTKKGCFPDCPGGCDFLVTWQHNTSNGGRVFHFSVQMMLGDLDNIWIAIGLSPTGKMVCSQTFYLQSCGVVQHI